MKMFTTKQAEHFALSEANALFSFIGYPKCRKLSMLTWGFTQDKEFYSVIVRAESFLSILRANAIKDDIHIMLSKIAEILHYLNETETMKILTDLQNIYNAINKRFDKNIGENEDGTKTDNGSAESNIRETSA